MFAIRDHSGICRWESKEQRHLFGSLLFLTKYTHLLFFLNTLIFFFIYCAVWSVCSRGCACHGTNDPCAEVKGQLARAESFLLPLGPWALTQVVGFGGKNPYFLSHLTSPGMLLFLGLWRKMSMEKKTVQELSVWPCKLWQLCLMIKYNRKDNVRKAFDIWKLQNVFSRNISIFRLMSTHHIHFRV